mmetsp:Transcript_11282/g.32510  ORF Transcript_11282/g.32510 Transcript_11282/m.32510 type:complete len:578 (+) Transcript_11282:282-2015(+)|eukprot:CAMPEP_0172358968 /NCGR_PEP_ID=MMETSP1060-20121228/3227_1 /TAXON_ID=37318 /ORGANISM="Pseudo-nitzschia pungens, Strain cf. cingulata" /LENGTH=577 /DNA_ID=CAMNT_0013080411 /DNA_START=228 /DNA_END=1961 /DNA_ORIENTATION=-
MVQSLIQRIRENKLDALYLFINESLRDRNNFDVFFDDLMVVLPNNWSINRVEIGHEFLSRTVVSHHQQQQVGQAQGNNNINNNNNNNDQIENGDFNTSKQDQLFRNVCSLESLRSLIISDGYIPRKDHGFVETKALLRNLPRANNLQYLDVQRLKLRITSDSIENNDSKLLEECLYSLRDSLEDLRLTAISFCDTTKSTTPSTVTTSEGGQLCRSQSALEEGQGTRRYPLDSAIRVCGDMANLQLLAISCATGCGCNCNNGEDQQHQEQHQQRQDGGLNQIAQGAADGSNSLSSSSSSSSSPSSISGCLISTEVLLRFCRSSTTLQELALRRMRIDDDTCKTLAKAFDPPKNQKDSRVRSSSLLPLSDSNDGCDEGDDNDSDSNSHHSPSFWTSLDLRQNPFIGKEGYEAILSSLERNYDLWCSLMVDNESFQSKFNALIELNQANRGALVRSPTSEKLAVFLDRLKDDPTALWYFLTIHRDAILLPLISFLKWKNILIAKKQAAVATTRGEHQLPVGQKRAFNDAMALQSVRDTSTVASSTKANGLGTQAESSNCDNQHQLLHSDSETVVKRPRQT